MVMDGIGVVGHKKIVSDSRIFPARERGNTWCFAVRLCIVPRKQNTSL